MMRIRWRGFELPTHVAVDQDSLTESYGRFIAEPFEGGFGHTIGNSLRRVLLSGLEGAAPVSLKIEGAAHEFTALPGVYEDITDIVLNVKNLRVRLEGDDPVTLRLEKQGPSEVRAGDFAPEARAQIANPELLLATLTDDRVFRAELVIERGRGYVPTEERPPVVDAEIGIVPLDASFSPIRRVRYAVEATRVGQRTDYDRLILEVWTDGTVQPEMALVEASTILRKHFNPFVKYHELGQQIASKVPAQIETAEDRAHRELEEKLALPVSVLDPSARAENCLAAANIGMLGDLVRRTEADMLKIKNFGKTSLRELKRKLADLGIEFGMTLEGPPAEPPPVEAEVGAEAQ